MTLKLLSQIKKHKHKSLKDFKNWLTTMLSKNADADLIKIFKVLF